MKFSVLISVFAKEKTEYFDRSLESIYVQSLIPDEVVIVKDGPIRRDLNEVINKFKNLLNIKVVLLEKNCGLGKALQVGLTECSYEIVARMDTDDIALPDRFKKQIEFLKDNPNVDVVGGWISEFDANENEVYAFRKPPIDSMSIRKYAKRRNPLNHVTVMFRKRKVLDAGGYIRHEYAEDYYLWVRMLMTNSKFANIPEVLVNVRAGRVMIERRGGLKYLFSEIKLQCFMIKSGFINIYGFIFNVFIRIVTRTVPTNLRMFIYKAIRQL